MNDRKKFNIKIIFFNLLLVCCTILAQSCGNNLNFNILEPFTKEPSNNPPIQSTNPTSPSSPISLVYENLVTPAPVINVHPTPTFNNPLGIKVDQYENLYIADSYNYLIRKVSSTKEVTTIAKIGGYRPADIAVDYSSGNIYMVSGNSVQKITPDGTVTTVAGDDTITGYNDALGTQATFYLPSAITIDSSGQNLYIADTSNCLVRKIAINNNYNVTTIAGNSLSACAFAADGVGPAAVFGQLLGITIDSANQNLYVTDLNNNSIRKIDLKPATYGTVSTFAGQNGVPGILNGPALGGATFTYPTGIAIDSSGRIYISDGWNSVIRKIDIDAPKTVSTLAGGAVSYADGNGASAGFSYPYGIGIGRGGNFYVVDANAHTIRKVTTTGVVSTYVGVPGKIGSDDNAGPRSLIATFNSPYGIKFDSAGNTYIADSGNSTIRKITSAGEVALIAGNNIASGYLNGNGAAAKFLNPSGTALDSSRNLYIADTDNNSIRKIDTAGNVTTVAGTGVAGYVDSIPGPPQFNAPTDIAIDSSGNLYIADSNNSAIRKITLPAATVTTIPGTSFINPNGLAIDSQDTLYVTDQLNNSITQITFLGGVPTGITTIAGNTNITGSTNGAGAIATFNNPKGIAIDASKNILYVADTYNHLIRKIVMDVSRTVITVSTFAGMDGVNGFADGTGTAASFNFPTSIALGRDENIYITDRGNNAIRKITPAGIVTTFMGVSGNLGSSDSIYGASQFLKQGGITKDSSNNIYVADTFSHLIRKIDPAGKMTVLAGSGSEGYADGSGTAASFRYPQGITMNLDGNLYVTDTFNHTIRQITPSGNVTTFAGIAGFNGSITTSLFNYPQGITTDYLGNLYVADTLNYAVRKITPARIVSTLAGQGYSGYTDGSASNAVFGYLKSLTIDSNNNMYILDTTNNVIRKLTNLLAAAPDVGTLIGLILGNNSSSYILNNSFNNVALGSDSNANIYVVDFVNNVIQKISNKNVLTTIAGPSGIPTISTGNTSSLLKPTSIYVDPAGKYLYVLENSSLAKIIISSD